MIFVSKMALYSSNADDFAVFVIIDIHVQKYGSGLVVWRGKMETGAICIGKMCGICILSDETSVDRKNSNRRR